MVTVMKIGTFLGLSTLKAELYAPQSNIDISGFSTICGRIAGEDVSLRGASRVLYDPALNNGGFADTDSILYDEDGTLIDEVRQLTELNPALLDSIEHAITAYDDDSDDFQFGNYRSGWKSEPTNRPNEVIYVLLVYGVDTAPLGSIGKASSQRKAHFFCMGGYSMKQIWADTRYQGFTLIELMLSLAILAALAVLAAPLFGNNEALQLDVTRRLLISDLEYSQILAITNPDDAIALVIDESGDRWHIATVASPSIPLNDSVTGDPLVTILGEGFSDIGLGCLHRK